MIEAHNSIAKASSADDRLSPNRPDALDLAILELLRRDARTSTRAIGRELGIAAGTAGQRIARLEAAGVIQGYSAIVNRARLGHELSFVISLQLTQRFDLESALDELIALDEVDQVLVVTGQWDLVVLGRVRDPEHLNELLINTIWKSRSFAHSESMLVINRRTAEAGAHMIVSS